MSTATKTKPKAKKPDRQKAKKTAPRVSSKAKKEASKGRSRPRLDDAGVKAEEKKYREKYPRVVRGSFQDITQKKGDKFEQKRSVEVRCVTRGCGNVRRIATSDLAQVDRCEECTYQDRLKRRQDLRREVAEANGKKSKSRKK